MATIWTWVYGSLQPVQVDDDEWMPTYLRLGENGECSKDGVEVGGTYLTADQVNELPEYVAFEEEQWRVESAQIDERRAARSDYVVVEVKHPTKNGWAAVWSGEPDKADEKIQALGAQYGPDRVRQRQPMFSR